MGAGLYGRMFDGGNFVAPIVYPNNDPGYGGAGI
jgi:hypothetical protein